MKTYQITMQNIDRVLTVSAALFLFILFSYSCKSINLGSLGAKTVEDQTKPEPDTKAVQDQAKPELDAKTAQSQEKKEPDIKAAEDKGEQELKAQITEDQTKPEPVTKAVKDQAKPETDTKVPEDKAKPEPDTKVTQDQAKPEPDTKTAQSQEKKELGIKAVQDRVKPELDAKSEIKPEDQKVQVEEKPGMVPFYQRGELKFKAKDMIKKMEEMKKRKRKALAKQKAQFQVLAEDRFKGKGLLFSFWVPPSDYPDEHSELRGYPKDPFGYPDWVSAVKKGIINPVDSISGGFQEEEMFDEDIIFEINDRMMANVRFPHSVHNFWLSCKVCHPGLFIPKKGANDISMTKIWNGKFCGRCHGAVAFVPKGFEACVRCHNVGREKVFMNY